MRLDLRSGFAQAEKISVDHPLAKRAKRRAHLTMSLVVRPLTPARWGDLETIFNAKGCSVARGCWCMYYRVSGKGPLTRPGDGQRSRSKEALKALADRDPPPGLIGYRGRTPVGWISLGPRQDFAKLAKSPVMKPVDDQPVWSVVCFVVPSEYRRQGVARELLAGAVAYARERGVRLLEAYPVDQEDTGAAEGSWFGSKRMFDAAGFKEVARRKPSRPVVRLKLVER
ncbi:MAG TPA: GNAT family N-acetyltransferase [Burkholderiaceae bacterium]|nr:GNAT family N-acetyltransferase [Burkholderiaceae bacterium]